MADPRITDHPTTTYILRFFLQSKELHDEKDPLDANLEKVLPGVHQWNQINQAEIAKLRDLLVTTSEQHVSSKVDELHQTLISTKQDTDQKVVRGFL